MPQPMLPIGTIVTSILPPSVFIRERMDGKWVPADGRDIPEGSKYEILATEIGQTALPDLRGMFVRGLNNFDDTRPSRNDGKQDPDGGTRSTGSYQRDEFFSHNHSVTDLKHGHNVEDPEHGHTLSSANKSSNKYDSGGNRSAWEYHGAGATGINSSITNISIVDNKANISIVDNGGNETRPKNIAVYYYILTDY